MSNETSKVGRKEFMAYRKCQKEGSVNMLDAISVMTKTGLNYWQYREIIDHYLFYLKRFEKKGKPNVKY